MAAQGRGSETVAARRAMPLVLDQVADGLRRIVAATAAKQGRKPRWLAALRSLDPDVVAFASLRAAFDALGSQTDLPNLLIRLGAGVEELRLMDAVRAHVSDGERVADAIVARNDRPPARVRGLRAAAANAGLSCAEPWTNERRLRAGEPLLNALLATGLFERHSETINVRTVDRLQLSREGEALVTEIDELAQWQKPWLLPMLVEPRPWVSEREGGYLSSELNRTVRLVRSFDREHCRLVQRSIEDGRLTDFLKALNTVQATRLRINRRLLEVVEWCWQNWEVLEEARRHPEARGIKKFPRQRKIDEVPPDAMEAATGADRLTLARRNRQIRRANRSVVSNVLSFRQDLATAREYVDHPAFWLPHNVDWRGRLYVSPFGEQKVVLNRFQRATDALIFDPDMWTQAVLRPWTRENLSKDGDNSKVMIVGEFSLKHKNYKGSALVTNLT